MTTRILAAVALSAALTACSTAEKNMAPEPTPAPAAAPAPAPAPTPPPPNYVVKDVHFHFDSSDLKQTAAESLDSVAAGLKQYPDVRYTIIGHTDSTGDEMWNQGLSERRASSVESYLISRGVPDAQMDVSGKGETMPIASNDTREGRAENRRVEIRAIK